MKSNDYLVTDKKGHNMSVEMSEKLRGIEPKTYEECYCVEACIFCYFEGAKDECQEFILSQDEDIQECLELVNSLDL